MPTEEQHIASANRTQKTLEHLLADVTTHSAHPRVAADERGPQFLEFVTRACLRATPLANRRK